MIVGTTGHIDHGKTTLVRALTGVDTDRLKEEKARGISIELGYAYTQLAAGAVLGFIDVPGHERLVHTMVAGACGIDFALLVVAADDGVMPQTREHLAILGLLGISHGAVALTKIDRVEPQRVSAAAAEVKAVLASTALSAAPLFALDATAAEHPGTRALRQHLHEVAARTQPRADQGLFRLAVDRVFTLAGHGTVVTGTVFAGQVSAGDTLVVMPAGRPVRVRGIHAQNRPAQTGHAGERCALNLAGIEKSAIARGDWLADRRALLASTRLDVRLHLLPESGARLTSWSPLHVHLATAHRVAHVVPLESAGLAAGDSARVQLVFAAPLAATAGDRFIVRDAQGRRTIGGGAVLDPCAPARRRRSAERLGFLGALERMLAGEGVTPLLEQARYGQSTVELERLTGRPAERVPLPSTALSIEAGDGRFVLLTAHWQALRAGALGALGRFHAEQPEEPGPDTARLRRISFPDMPGGLWRALIDELARERLLLRNGAWLRLPQHAVSLSTEEQTLLCRLQPLIAAGGFDPPWVRELAAALHEPEERVRAVLRKQVAQGGLYQVVRDLFYDRERIAELAAIIHAATREQGSLDAARFRDAVGLGRKRAIQILEFFDRVGYTRRVHDAHVLRTDSAWHLAREAGSGGAPPRGELRKAPVPGGATGLQTQEGAADASW
jgi:selenocysteine-specific elongation factor